MVYAWDIGYIGYLSGRRILDFVGIVSPEVVAANRRRDFIGVLRRHRPDWAVVGLYGNAYRQIVDSAWFCSNYEAVHRTAVPGLDPWPDDDPRRLAAYRPDYVVHRLRRGAAGGGRKRLDRPGTGGLGFRQGCENKRQAAAIGEQNREAEP